MYLCNVSHEVVFSFDVRGVCFFPEDSVDSGNFAFETPQSDRATGVVFDTLTLFDALFSPPACFLACIGYCRG